MNVVHLSTSDTNGGAARAAYRLHRGLRKEGVCSEMLVREKQSKDDSVCCLKSTRSLKRILQLFCRYARINLDFSPYYFSKSSYLEVFSDDRTRFRGEVTDQIPSANILHLHWISGFVDIRSFFNMTSAPVVWTLHDMAAFTGGCHYDMKCGRYTTECGCCPQLGSRREEDLSRSIWNRKRDAYQKAIRECRLHVVAPSKWLARRAQQSSLLREAQIHVIPNGLDHTIFRPRNAKDRRRKLGIPENHKTVLFVSQSTSNYRKGFCLLDDAIKDVDDKNVTLVSVGSNKPSISGDLPHVHVGRIEDDEKLAELYSMASVFVIPSRQDNLPNTVLESMACGTPVVGFDNGGIRDMVRPEETGWLAETGNVRSLRKAIAAALSDQSDLGRKAKRCREVVKNEYTLEEQSKRYKSLYESIHNNKIR